MSWMNMGNIPDISWDWIIQQEGYGDLTPEEQAQAKENFDQYQLDIMSPEESYDYYAGQAGDVDVMQPVYDDTGRIIGYNATGSIDDPLEKDYSSLWEQLDEAKETGIPDLDTWMTDQGYDFYDPMARDEAGTFTNQTMQDMQALIDQLTTGPTAMELGDAQAYAAQLMGIDPADYQTIVGGLLQTFTADIGSLQGFSPEERALRERANRNELRGMEERASRLMDNIAGSTGSTSRAYAAADQALSQINDAQIQQSMAIADEDYRRKVNQSESAERQWANMVQAGQMGQEQYLNLLQESKSMAFEGYAVQVNTMMEQNQQYLQQYGGDLQAIEMNINNIYKAIQMEIGIDEKAMNDIERAYQMEMAPILTQMDIALQQIQLEQAEDAAKWGNIFSFLTLGVSLLAIPFTSGLSLLAVPEVIDQYEH